MNEPSANSFRKYKARNGEILEFDTSFEKAQKFGFFPDMRVLTPKGPATVIGVRDNTIWFHIDGESGASFWERVHSYEDVIQNNIFMYEPDEERERNEGSFYQLKRIDYKGRQTKILLQNQNGPCPLIAIANVLALRNDITLDQRSDKISVTQLSDIISQFIKKKQQQQMSDLSAPDQKKEIEESIKLIPSLQYGLDVNCGFTSWDSFEKNAKMKIFEMLNIRMLHGWIVDPSEKVASIIGNDTYEDLTLKLVSSDPSGSIHLNNPSNSLSISNNSSSNFVPSSPNSSSLSPMSTSATPSTPTNTSTHAITTPSTPSTSSPISIPPSVSHSSVSSPGSASKDSIKKYSKEEAVAVRAWLDENSHQLSSWGLLKLHDSIKQDELVVFFRNNHFSTLTSRDGGLLNLVTDIGYEKERNIVWEKLSSTHGGGSQFFNGMFQTVDEAKLEEVKNTALQFGFETEKIDQAIAALSKPDTELKVDDVLQFLQAHFPLPT